MTPIKNGDSVESVVTTVNQMIDIANEAASEVLPYHEQTSNVYVGQLGLGVRTSLNSAITDIDDAFDIITAAGIGYGYELSQAAIDQLLPSGAGRVAAIYSDPTKPSYDECIQKNMDAIAAGRPQDCVLFADAAGQTPVVYPIGAGQGKGLLLDRSAGLVRGVEHLSGNWAPTATWTKDGADLLSNNTTNVFVLAALAVPLDTYSWYEVQFNIKEYTSGVLRARLRGGTQSMTPQVGGVGLRKFLLYSDTNTSFDLEPSFSSGFVGRVGDISVKKLPGHHQHQPTASARGEFSRRYNQLTGTDTLATQSITTIAAQYRLYFTGAGTITLSGAATGVYSAGSHTITCSAGTLTLTVAGEVLTADLRFEADATIGLPVYQRVTTASDYDEVGFPTYWRAQTDDWAKSHMDPAGATKAYVFWAGQKMSITDAPFVETSVSSSGGSNGVLMLSQSTGGGDTFLLRSRGTATANASHPGGGIAMRAAISGTCYITNDICALTVNGTTTTNNFDQGTGTYLEHDVFFGARAGTSLFANIREYAPPTILFLQPTDSLSDSDMEKLQKGYAKAVGVTL